jgi:hypothetical protein
VENQKVIAHVKVCMENIERLRYDMGGLQSQIKEKGDTLDKTKQMLQERIQEQVGSLR